MKLNFDGAATGTPGPAGGGAVITDGEGRIKGSFSPVG